jgi:hypothetical protein
MNSKFNELTNSLAQSVTRRNALRKLGAGTAALVLTCFLASSSLAQTTVVCDAAGDPTWAGAKGGPKIPAWLDIVQTDVSDAGSDIHFTLTLAGAIPTAPAWAAVDDGGQIWWGWRFVNDLANDFAVKDGCLKANGSLIPAGYFLDLIWDVTTSTFRARLIDDTTCVQNGVLFAFSSDRKQVTLIVSKSLLSNQVTIPNPNSFQFFAATLAWKANKTGNNSFFGLDAAPDGGALQWSASQNASYFCQ